MNPKEKADSIRAKNAARFEKLMQEAMQLLNLPRNLNWRARRMLEITDEIAGMAAPVSPCKKGCAYCCYQAIVISDWEADQISEMTGKKIADFEGYNPVTNSREKMIEKYNNKICPFLIDSECSIYAFRPFICRTHISMADDSFLCDLNRNPGAEVPYFNLRDLNMIQGMMFLSAQCKFGDIREFFA